MEVGLFAAGKWALSHQLGYHEGMTNIAIIGTGNIASTAHAPAIAAIPETRLTAVLSRNEESGTEFLRQHGTPEAKVYTKLADLAVDPGVDLVIVTSPDFLHYEQARACLEAGKHVLLEKPMTLEAQQAEELATLARSKGLVLAIGFHLRSHAGHRLLRDKIIQGKAVGNVRHIRVVWSYLQTDDTNWRAKDEFSKWWSLSAVGSHCIDLARWFADDMNDWQQLKATIANNLWHGPHDETAIVAGQVSNGVTVEVVSSVQFGPYNRIEIFGDQGNALCDDTLGRAGAGSININGEQLDFTPVNPFASQLQNVLSAINDTAALNAPAEAGVRSVQDLLKIMEHASD